MVSVRVSGVWSYVNGSNIVEWSYASGIPLYSSGDRVEMTVPPSGREIEFLLY